MFVVAGQRTSTSVSHDSRRAAPHPPPSPPPSPPALRRSGVVVLPASTLFKKLLPPLHDIFAHSSHIAQTGAARCRTTDLKWAHLPSLIQEVTIVPDPSYWSAFSNDLGAMVGGLPPRATQSDFWAVVDYVWGETFLPALEKLVVGRVGPNALLGLQLSGVQAAWSPPRAKRDLHHDQLQIARLLVTFTTDGSGTIGIEGVERDGDYINTTFEQMTGDGYCLHGHGTQSVRHGTIAGPMGRWAVTFRFSRLDDARPHKREDGPLV